MRQDSASRIIQGWAEAQTRFWCAAHAGQTDFTEVFARLNETRRGIFLFDLGPSGVAIRPKAAFDDGNERHASAAVETGRAELYRHFIAECIAGSGAVGTIAVDVDDQPLDCFEAPVFAFHKLRGSPNLLLPDPDFFYFNWYADDRDPISPADKRDCVVFVGASTGGIVHEADVLGHGNPRLRLAQTLVAHPDISFHIGAAVQCVSTEVQTLLEAQPYFTGPQPWERQLDARFILSLDGNGATCSRVVRTLMSNSLLMKFASEDELYYHDALQPFVHYLPVRSVADIETLLARHREGRLNHAGIRDAANHFARTLLSRPAVVRYARALLESYFGIMSAVPPARSWRPRLRRLRGR